MGNSEVGHMNIGAGKVVYQDLVKINKAVAEHTLDGEPALVEALEYAKSRGRKVHFMGLVSDGGVHSHIDHLKALCHIARNRNVTNFYVHAFTDGRDTDPKGGLAYLQNCRAPWPSRAANWPRSPAATTPWTATTAGNA
jgi:2,3-bisphosphoglycerate-independent phosphoglycerate mutase